MDKKQSKTCTLAVCLVLTAYLETPFGSQVLAAEPEGETAGAGASWSVPRTPWGDPDLQGMWPLESVSGIPFQRPPEFGERAFLTDEEFQARVEEQERQATAYARENAADRIGQGHWLERDSVPLRQTSLIVEPANGRIPSMTEEGREQAANMKSSWSEEVFDDISDFNVLDRCITRGMPASMLPFPYNNGLQIIQTPGYVVINLELVHETRIIPVDGRPQLPNAIRPWLGSSRGHWEGSTLVIETTNFNGHTPMVIVGPSNQPIPTSTDLHIVERLTPTGPDTIQYEAVVEDPTVLTAPWKMAFPWTRNEGYEMFEYACHEGNTVVEAYIKATNPRYHLDAAAGEQ